DYVLESQDQHQVLRSSFDQLLQHDKLPLHQRLVYYCWPHTLGPIKLTTTAQSPKGAGLGGSSCLAVAILQAIIKARQELGQQDPRFDSKQQWVTILKDIEAQVIQSPTGSQDYWGGIYGGLNII
ncbi:MAG: hypothetical protein CUN55_20235, partial [Phototrophicales bacterium]